MDKEDFSYDEEEYLKELIESMNVQNSPTDQELAFVATETMRMVSAFLDAGFTRQESLTITMMIMLGGPE